MLVQIKTKRLLLTLANMGDLPALEKIEQECNEYFRFDPPNAAEYNRPLRELKNGFDRITEVECTGNLYPDDFGGLGLIKIINPSE